jgi:low affinity Fe/Cu permease
MWVRFLFRLSFMFGVPVAGLAILVLNLWRLSGESLSFGYTYAMAVVGAVAVVIPGIGVLLVWRINRVNAEEAQARQRVRQAEDDLAEALRGGQETNITIVGNATIYPDSVVPEESDRPSTDGQVPLNRRDDGLTLAALWNLTHGKLDLYHTIVTGQAKRSFGAAQVAMGIGFVLLVVFAVLAAETKTTTAAISAGGLGAVGAAFAAYIGKTFIRSQETAASHLRAYFDQPLELSRYLAAERLLADAADLTAEQRAAILSALVQSIATAGHDNTKNGKPAGRQSRGRASR